MSDPATHLSAGLYIVATPIGNLGDLSPRAADVLRLADLILVEDSRVSRPLLARFGVEGRVQAYHDHNETMLAPRIVERLTQEAVALISDAGTPTIADPGYRLVKAAADAGAAVYAVPGPSALIAALSVAGLPTDRFLFVGFPPPKVAARGHFWDLYTGLDTTLVFYEAPHRLCESLTELAARQPDRPAAVARELTKRFEEVRRGSVADLATHYATTGEPRGEIVVVLGPPPVPESRAPDDPAVQALLAALVPAVGVKRAARLVADVTGRSAQALYTAALAWSAPS